ncbi:MAG: YgeY family selenium metabolism-linked hydrolase [Candidatus Bathyarchaeia archaeon]
MSDIQSILEHIERRKGKTISLLQEMVKTPSVTGEEKTIAELIAHEMRTIGLSNVRIDGLGNVIGETGGGEKTQLLYNGHMDTVPVGERDLWQIDPYSGEVRDGKVWGRGACDMKGALAAMLSAADALNTANQTLQGKLIITAVVLEENAALEGTKYTIEEDGIKPDYALVGEATGLNVSLGSRGRIELQLTSKGRTAHASTPTKGVNAIMEMVKLAGLLEEMKLPRHEFLGSTTQAITNITCSPGRSNVIPDLCTVTIDRRIVPGEDQERVVKDFMELFSGSGIREEEYAIRVSKYAPPAYVPPENPVVKALSRAAESVTGKTPEFTKYRFGTDASYLGTIAGIPTVGLGPGDEMLAHSPNENVPIDEVITAAKIYAMLALTLLA